MVETLKEIAKKFESILNDFLKNGNKLSNAAQFLDYFIHSVLDYSVLNGKSSNFTKNIDTFDIRDCINQIVDIMQNKANMKNINV